MFRLTRYLLLFVILLLPVTASAQDTRPRQDRVYRGETITFDYPAGWNVLPGENGALFVTNAVDVRFVDEIPNQFTLNDGEILLQLRLIPLTEALSVGAAADIVAGDVPAGTLPQPILIGTYAAYQYEREGGLILVYKPTGQLAVRADILTSGDTPRVTPAIETVLASIRATPDGTLPEAGIVSATLPNLYVAPNAALRVNFPDEWLAVELDASSIMVVTSFEALFNYFEERPLLEEEVVIDIYLPNPKELSATTAEIIEGGDLPDNTEIVEFNGQPALLSRYEEAYVYLFDLPTGRPVRVRVAAATEQEIETILPTALEVAASLSSDIAPPQPVPALTQTFTGDQTSLQFQYPADWDAREFGDGTVVLNSTVVTDEFEDLVPGEIDIILRVNDRYPRIAGESNEDRARYAAENWIEEEVSDSLPYRTVTITDLEAGLTTAYTRVYSEIMSEVPEDWMFYFVMASDDQIVTVSVLAYPNELYLYEPTVRAVLGTISLD